MNFTLAISKLVYIGRFLPLSLALVMDNWQMGIHLCMFVGCSVNGTNNVFNWRRRGKMELSSWRRYFRFPS